MTEREKHIENLASAINEAFALMEARYAANLPVIGWEEEVYDHVAGAEYALRKLLDEEKVKP